MKAVGERMLEFKTRPIVASTTPFSSPIGVFPKLFTASSVYRAPSQVTNITSR